MPAQVAAPQQLPAVGGAGAAALQAAALLQQPLQDELAHNFMLQQLGSGGMHLPQRTTSTGSGRLQHLHGAAGQQLQLEGQQAQLGGQLGAAAWRQLPGLQQGLQPGWGLPGAAAVGRLPPDWAALAAQLKQHNALPAVHTDPRL